MKAKRERKMADMPAYVAATAFVVINAGLVHYFPEGRYGTARDGEIVADVDPEDLTYPEGWYFCKDCFRNKHNSSTGIYEEIPVFRQDGNRW